MSQCVALLTFYAPLQFLAKEGRSGNMAAPGLPNHTSKPYHYGSHYSNSGIVLHFMVRMPPFTEMFLAFQGRWSMYQWVGVGGGVCANGWGGGGGGGGWSMYQWVGVGGVGWGVEYVPVGRPGRLFECGKGKKFSPPSFLHCPSPPPFSPGRSFDIADRTFRDMATTWWLSSSESATDVKELVPEFFYLPEFLVNSERESCS